MAEEVGVFRTELGSDLAEEGAVVVVGFHERAVVAAAEAFRGIQGIGPDADGLLELAEDGFHGAPAGVEQRHAGTVHDGEDVLAALRGAERHGHGVGRPAFGRVGGQAGEGDAQGGEGVIDGGAAGHAFEVDHDGSTQVGRRSEGRAFHDDLAAECGCQGLDVGHFYSPLNEALKQGLVITGL